MQRWEIEESMDEPLTCSKREALLKWVRDTRAEIELGQPCGQYPTRFHAEWARGRPDARWLAGEGCFELEGGVKCRVLLKSPSETDKDWAFAQNKARLVWPRGGNWYFENGKLVLRDRTL